MANKDYIERHRSWQKYANKEIDAGRKPLAFKRWRTDLKSKPKSKKTSNVYFKGIKRETTESGLKRSGLDWEKDKPSARLKRSKKK